MAMTFEQWKKQVENIVYTEIQCYLDDLPDENYKLNYNYNVSPEVMAQIVINNNVN
jgi:hypothetical protein